MKTTNKKLPIIVGIILVIVVAVVGTIMIVQNNGHRVIKVDKVSGDASLEREATKQEIYEGINLKSQDTVITGQDGQVELLVDSDKHIWARENTKFKVVSNGDENKGKLKIELQYGTSLVEIEEKLPEGAFFEVETPNATIGVRGTIFETSYDEKENKTIVVVTSGVVEVTTDTETVMVEEGQKAIVVDDVIKDAETDVVEDVVGNIGNTDDNDRETGENDVEDITVEYSANGNEVPFELGMWPECENTGIGVKQLEGWDVEFLDDFGMFKKKGISIIPMVCKEQFYRESMDLYEGQLGSEWIKTIENTAGDIVTCVLYDSKEQNATNRYSYLMFKPIEDDLYLYIAISISDEDGGVLFGEIDIEKFIVITTNDYYVSNSN